MNRLATLWLLLFVMLAPPRPVGADDDGVSELSGQELPMGRSQMRSAQTLPSQSEFGGGSVAVRLSCIGGSREASVGGTRESEAGATTALRSGRAGRGMEVAEAPLAPSQMRERDSGRPLGPSASESAPGSGAAPQEEGADIGGSGPRDFDSDGGNVVRFESDPSGADLWVDGRHWGVTPSRAELTEGIYSVVFELVGYEPLEESVVVSGPRTVLGQLTPLSSWISVTTEPEDLMVWLDGRAVGLSPLLRYGVTAGLHTVLVRDARYYDAGHQGFGLQKNQHRKFHFEPEVRLGAIRVRAQEAGAGGSAVSLPVIVDGEEVGVTPWGEKVTVGTHWVSVVDQVRQVDVAEREVVVELFEIAAARNRVGVAGGEGANSIGLEMVRISAGSFMMGSGFDESDRENDEWYHRVTLTHDFLLASTEVSQGQWERVMGGNPSYFTGSALPAEQVTWYEAVEFCNNLSEREGLSKAYVVRGEDVSWDRSAAGYRLPTEAEWEYACRAGKESPFHFGDRITTAEVNYDGRSPYKGGRSGQFREQTVAVGSLPVNTWGLHEMHGNVWEWCWDRFGDYAEDSLINPTGAPQGAWRVFRGGGWQDPAQFCRSAVRYFNGPGYRFNYLGLRPARPAP